MIKIKKNFTWFFTNLYYHYAKSINRDSDARIVTTIGFFLLLPIGVALATFIAIPGVPMKGHKLIYFLLCSFVVACFYLISYKCLYKNKLYLKILDNYPEKNPDPDPKIKFYLFLYIIIPIFIAISIALLMKGKFI